MTKRQNSVIRTSYMNRNFKNDMWLEINTWKTTRHHIIREMQIKITWAHYTTMVPLKLESLNIPSKNVKNRNLACGASDETIKGHQHCWEELGWPYTSLTLTHSMTSCATRSERTWRKAWVQEAFLQCEHCWPRGKGPPCQCERHGCLGRADPPE